MFLYKNELRELEITPSLSESDIEIQYFRLLNQQNLACN